MATMRAGLPCVDTPARVTLSDGSSFVLVTLSEIRKHEKPNGTEPKQKQTTRKTDQVGFIFGAGRL